MIGFNEIVIRLLVSLLAGGVIGIERQYHDKPAGFATNTLICLGSTIFALISLLSAQYFGGDPARIAAQIVTGVGFLGAGSILREGNKISGLTTAAGIWVVAAIGMAVGYGKFEIAGISVLAVMILQIFVRRLLNHFDKVKTFECLTIKCEPNLDILKKIETTIKNTGAVILKNEFYKENGYLIIKMTTDMSEVSFKKSFKELLLIKEIISLSK